MRALGKILVGCAGFVGASSYCYFSGSPLFFQHLVMPAARMLDPETAHRASILLASRALVPRDRRKDPHVLVSELASPIICICA